MSLKLSFKDALKLKWPILKNHFLKIILLLLGPDEPSCYFFFLPLRGEGHFVTKL